MAPRAEKKPTEEKKAAVAEKAPAADKKPKVGKKLPKDRGSGAGDKKKKRSKKSVETYKIYIFKPGCLLERVAKIQLELISITTVKIQGVTKMKMYVCDKNQMNVLEVNKADFESCNFDHPLPRLSEKTWFRSTSPRPTTSLVAKAFTSHVLSELGIG